MPHESKTDFERAAQERENNILTELFAYIRANRKWVLLPIIVVLLLIGGLILLSGTAAAPFIYTLF